MFVITSVAFAQTVGGAIPPTSGQLFRPSIDATHTLWVNDTSRSPDAHFLARALAHYALDPVVYESDDGDITRVVGDLFQLSFTAGYTKGPIRFGVDVPVYLRNVGTYQDETGIGDILLDIKGTVLDRRDRPIGLAFAGRASMPTATVKTSLGNQGFGWEVEGIVDKEVGNLLLALNLGARGVPRAELENFKWGEQLVARLGGGYAFDDRGGFSVDLASHVNLTDPTARSIPIEGLLGGWAATGHFRIRGGVGTGLSPGFGAPALRAMVGIGYEPPRTRDTDEDGITDREDGCPEEAEDLDGFADEDGCPEPTTVRVKVLGEDGRPIEGARVHVRLDDGERTLENGDSFSVFGGSYSIDVEAVDYEPIEGDTLEVPDQERFEKGWVLKEVPKLGSVKVVVQDPEGQPLAGAHWTLDGQDLASGAEHQLLIGTYPVRIEAEGYRPEEREVEVKRDEVSNLEVRLQPSRVQVTAERIDIKESIFFETGKAVIKEESHSLLEEVAQTLRDHPELLKIRIEGHTDSRGNAATNLQLSKDRAAAVVQFLVEQGVAADRLESEGYGESRPLEKGNNEAAWSKNRRVDFFVAERGDE